MKIPDDLSLIIRELMRIHELMRNEDNSNAICIVNFAGITVRGVERIKMLLSNLVTRSYKLEIQVKRYCKSSFVHSPLVN